MGDVPDRSTFAPRGTLLLALQEAKGLLDQQVALISRLDERAAQVMTTGATILGVFTASAGLVPRVSGQSPSVVVVLCLGGGMALLLGTIVLSGMLYVRIRIAIGLGAKAFLATLDHRVSQEVFLDATIRAYATCIEANRRLHHEAGRRMTAVLVSLAAGMALGTLGIVGLIWTVIA